MSFLDGIIDDTLGLNELTGQPLTKRYEHNIMVDGGGRLSEVLTVTDVDAQNNTFTVAQAVGGIVRHTSATGGGTVTTDTAVNFIAGSSGKMPLVKNGQAYVCYYINDGDQTLTLAGGTGVTVGDTGQTIATNESALLLIQRLTATTVGVDIIGA